MAREEYDNTNRGALFENTRSSHAKAPQWRGQCTIRTPDGELVEYWISCWEQESRKGDTFLSLSFEEKEESQTSSRDRGRDDDRRSRGRDDRDDDRAPRRSAIGRGRREDDRPRARDDRDDDRRRRDDDRPREATRSAKDDLDDEIPF